MALAAAVLPDARVRACAVDALSSANPLPLWSRGPWPSGQLPVNSLRSSSGASATAIDRAPWSAERTEALPDSTAPRILRGIVCQKEVVMYQFHPPRRRGSPVPPEFDTDCGGVWANSNTSCPFAQNVHEKWMSEGGGSAATIEVYSPVTEQ